MGLEFLLLLGPQLLGKVVDDRPFSPCLYSGPSAVVPGGQVRGERRNLEPRRAQLLPVPLGVSCPAYQMAGPCHTGALSPSRKQCASIYLTWGPPGDSSISRSPAPIYQAYQPIWRENLWSQCRSIFSGTISPSVPQAASCSPLYAVALAASAMPRGLDHHFHPVPCPPLHLPIGHTPGSLPHGPKCVLHGPRVA